MTTELTSDDAADLRFAAGCVGPTTAMTLIHIAEKIDNMTATAATTFNTRGPRAGSFNSLVQELNPGESVSKVREVDPTMTVARLPFEMPEIRQQARNAVAPAVSRAKAITGGTYTVESGDVAMGNGSMYVVVVVKRVE